MIDIGYYIEAAIEWLTKKGAGFFDALNVGVESFIDSFQLALYTIPFYIFIPLTALLAWWKTGKGMGVFTLLGLLLIWGMGFWEETMQTLALVLSSTCMADRNPTRHLVGKKWTLQPDTPSRSRLYADHACFRLSDSCGIVLRIGYGSRCFRHHHLCHASGGTAYGIGHTAST